jgi:hypothetical protein
LILRGLPRPVMMATLPESLPSCLYSIFCNDIITQEESFSSPMPARENVKNGPGPDPDNLYFLWLALLFYHFCCSYTP